MVTEQIEDLSPYLAERCRLFVLLAKQAPVGLVIRRGPTKWWRASLWDTRTDTIAGGQWFHGSLYPERCDLSPNGKLWLYFCGKHRRRDIEAGYADTYSAVSRPPYFTALGLWPCGGTWEGGGVFWTIGLWCCTNPPSTIQTMGRKGCGWYGTARWTRGISRLRRKVAGGRRPAI